MMLLKELDSSAMPVSRRTCMLEACLASVDVHVLRTTISWRLRCGALGCWCFALFSLLFLFLFLLGLLFWWCWLWLLEDFVRHLCQLLILLLHVRADQHRLLVLGHILLLALHFHEPLFE